MLPIAPNCWYIATILVDSHNASTFKFWTTRYMSTFFLGFPINYSPLNSFLTAIIAILGKKGVAFSNQCHSHLFPVYCYDQYQTICMGQVNVSTLQQYINRFSHGSLSRSCQGHSQGRTRSTSRTSITKFYFFHKFSN